MSTPTNTPTIVEATSDSTVINMAQSVSQVVGPVEASPLIATEPLAVLSLAPVVTHTKAVPSGPSKGLSAKVAKSNWCLFEDHVFDHESKSWVPADPKNGIRRCLHSLCTRQHKLPNRPVKVCKNETNCPDAGTSCFLLHDNTKIRPLCHYGKNCADLECKDFRHPKDRTTEVCPENEKCEHALITCFKLHSLSKITPVCRFKNGCVNFICIKRHGPGRKAICEHGPMCYRFIKYGPDVTSEPPGCDQLHPKILQKICRWDDSTYGCKTYGCAFVHSPDSAIDCLEGIDCPAINGEEDDYVCRHKHPRAY